jgi:hypothetical protein
MSKYRERIDQINKQIKDLESKRTEIQEECPHENTKDVDYMWRIGSTMAAEVCSDCYKFIKSNESYGTIK